MGQRNSAQFYIEWSWSVTIDIPWDLTLMEVVKTAVAKRLWIPCIDESWHRVFLTLPGTSVASDKFWVINITRKNLNDLFNVLEFSSPC